MESDARCEHLKMGVDGTMVQGEGVVVNWVHLSQEEKEVYKQEMRALVEQDDEGELLSRDHHRGWEWLTAFWIQKPNALFTWTDADWSRPHVITPEIPQGYITTTGPFPADYYDRFYALGYRPFLVCLDQEDYSSEVAARIKGVAPGIADIILSGSRAVMTGKWIFYTTS